MKLQNTATNEKQDFTPLNENEVLVYTCGPTVYDSLHIGNWSAYIYWDVLVRTLEKNGYKVKRVLNITDVGHLVSDSDTGEDKLQKSAQLQGKTAWDIASHYTEEFLNDMHQLGLKDPSLVAKATDYIEDQIKLVRTLKEKGYTYQIDDGIYFDTSKFADYSKFAKLHLESQLSGARVQENISKKNPSDFAIWKFSPLGEQRDMQWDTPIDLLENEQPKKGFPGWHLECSAIILKTLGETIDIHTGGIDHIPVHHSNEIAQSQCATGKPLARYWLHNNHLKIDGTKISKSLGNGVTLTDLRSKGYDANTIKLFVLQGNYHNEGNFTFENIDSAKHRLHNWMNYSALRHQTHDTLYSDKEKSETEGVVSFDADASGLLSTLNDDLNTPEALKAIDQAFSTMDDVNIDNIDQESLLYYLETIEELLGIDLLKTTPDISDDAKQIILERESARESKDWAKSDDLRNNLLEQNIVINDTSYGPVWSYKFN